MIVVTEVLMDIGGEGYLKKLACKAFSNLVSYTVPCQLVQKQSAAKLSKADRLPKKLLLYADNESGSKRRVSLSKMKESKDVYSGIANNWKSPSKQSYNMINDHYVSMRLHKSALGLLPRSPSPTLFRLG